jgi:Flp pilus assembly pilin Flp
MSDPFHLLRDESGQDLIEYSLLITFIVIACLALIASGRPATNAIWATANTDLTAGNNAAGGHH